jgi:DNA-binding NtrC family response regulator
MEMTDESVVIVGASRASDEAASALISESWTVVNVDTLKEASAELETGRHQVVVLDTDAVTEPPWQALETLRERDATVAILLMVGSESPWSAFSSYRQRPAGLVLKPLDRAALLMAIDSALVYRKLLEENRSLKRQLGSAVSLSDWVGCTPESGEIRKSIATAALANGNVLLLGEDGTGRRLLAELLHRHGRNPGATFLPVDLASLPTGELDRLFDEVLEATDSRRGAYVRGARPGTLYLAELTALASEDQRKLIVRLEAPLPFRIVASANPSIVGSVQKGAFAEDAFRSISRIRIQIPTLRARRADIPLLVDHFLKRACERSGLRPLGIPSTAIETYSSYDWPGNVSELAMWIERAVSIASAAKFDGTSLPEHFCAPPSLTVPEGNRLKDISLRELIADIEKRIILQTLERVDGSQKRAAAELRLNPTTLHEKMKRYKLLPSARRS